MDAELAALLERSARLRPAERGPGVGLCVPGMVLYHGRRGRFPALSLTGQTCGLGCPHCQGRLLQGMFDASRPAALIQQAVRLAGAGARGLLVSGGCDAGARLPWERFAQALAEAKRASGLYLAVHCAYVNQAQAELLATAGVDLAMIDVIGDERAAKLVYGLAPGRVAESLAALAQAGLTIAPHVVVGLDHGRLAGEERAVEMALAAGAATLVLAALRPLAGTPMAGASPPAPEDVARLIARARVQRPELVINLGCGRPRGPHAARLDHLALLAGVDNIAVPAPATAQAAVALGRRPGWHDVCCAAPPGLASGGAAGESEWSR